MLNYFKTNKNHGYFILLFVYIISYQTVDCQNVLSDKAFDTITRVSFAKMVTGIENISSTANYVSFVPSDGKFTLAGNYFLNLSKENKDDKNFAIGFNASGSLIDGKLAQIFSGGSINTGLELGVNLNIRLNKRNIGYIQSDMLAFNNKKMKLDQELEFKIDSIRYDFDVLEVKLRKSELSIIESENKVKSINAEIIDVNKKLNDPNNSAEKLKYTRILAQLKDSIYKENVKIKKLKIDATKLNEIFTLKNIKKGQNIEDLSSVEKNILIKYGINKNSITYEDSLVNKIKAVYKIKVFNAELKEIPIKGLKVSWLGLILNVDRQSYRTYFESQIRTNEPNKEKFTGLTIGIQSNFYSINKVSNKSHLFNASIIYKRTNNLSDLSTSKFLKETYFDNDTISRKIIREDNVYTDTIKNLNILRIPLNYYRYFGKDLSLGWHIFAQADIRSDKKHLYDLGAGFIFGLNKEKEERLFNIELYSKYTDLANNITAENSRGWKKLEFGISFALPFMMFKN